ncbi:MAG TPA: DUF2142 domain-containing protein [Frankiaceae bacterium]|nr:DUF2142 domain-containing protein [Frankiaceae bacterium]
MDRPHRRPRGRAASRSRPVLESPDGLGPWQLMRRAPRPVWLVTALFALILAGWSVLAPLYHAADEPNHADAVMRLEEGRGWPSATTARITDEGIGATLASPYGRPANRLLINYLPIPASLAPGRHDRPKWQDLKARPGTSGQVIQQITQHPPGYYWYEALILRAGGAAGWRWDIAVSTMRLLSALLVVWLPLLSWATAWKASGRRRAGIIASIFPLAVPEFSHVGASVTNDNLIALAGAATTLGVVCALRGDRTRKTALWTGVWLAIALWSKAFGLALVPLVFVVYAADWIRGRPARSLLPDRSSGILLALSSGVGVGLGCWWYVVNEIHYGALQPGVPNFPPGKFLGNDPLAELKYTTQGVLGRWWGSLGWYEVNLPWRLVVVATVIVLAITLWAFLRLRGRRAVLLALAYSTVLVYLLIVGQAVHYYLRHHYVAGLSGRYLFIGFSGVAAMVGVGLGALPSRVARWMPFTLLVAALGMQAEAARLAVNHWWRPVGGSLRQAWTAFSAWSTWPVGALWSVIGVAALLALAALVTFAVYGIKGEGVTAESTIVATSDGPNAVPPQPQEPETAIVSTGSAPPSP